MRLPVGRDPACRTPPNADVLGGAQHWTFPSVECSRLRDGRPDGDVAPYDPVFFPFDPDLDSEADLGRQPVSRRPDGPDVEERYVVAPNGAVEVTLTTRPAGLMRTFRLHHTSPTASRRRSLPRSVPTA